MNLKWGPFDLQQISTWRGLIGLFSVFGWVVSPALAEQIALVAVALFSLIEVLRNEYYPRKIDRFPPVDPKGPRKTERMRHCMDVPPGHRTQPGLDERDSSTGFNDR